MIIFYSEVIMGSRSSVPAVCVCSGRLVGKVAKVGYACAARNVGKSLAIGPGFFLSSGLILIAKKCVLRYIDQRIRKFHSIFQCSNPFSFCPILFFFAGHDTISTFVPVFARNFF